MNFKPKRAKKSKAHVKYGRMKKIQPAKLEPGDRKVVVCYSLPQWQVGRIEQECELASMHKSTFVAAAMEACFVQLDESRKVQAAMEEEIESGNSGNGDDDEEQNDGQDDLINDLVN